MEKILILRDWRGALTSKLRGDKNNHSTGIADTNLIGKRFEELGYYVEIRNFSGMDWTRNYRDWYVIYSSSEERGLFYKEFIEDVLLRLELDGACLIPEFKYFRAHHNKVFQELLRLQFRNPEIKKPASKVLGRFEELSEISEIKFPCVVKTSGGAGSSGVCLVRDKRGLEIALLNFGRQLYRDHYFTLKKDIWNSRSMQLIKGIAKVILRKEISAYNYRPYTLSNKVILQDYIPDLTGDYKVLYFYGKYYVLNRKNRENDFRASGSGKFVYPCQPDEITPILNFAAMVAVELNVPLISMDIGCNIEGCFLIEYQCLNFGAYTIQYSDWYFIKEKNTWLKVEGKSVLEEEYCRSINQFIKANKG